MQPAIHLSHHLNLHSVPQNVKKSAKRDNDLPKFPRDCQSFCRSQVCRWLLHISCSQGLPQAGSPAQDRSVYRGYMCAFMTISVC